MAPLASRVLCLLCTSLLLILLPASATGVAVTRHRAHHRHRLHRHRHRHGHRHGHRRHHRHHSHHDSGKQEKLSVEAALDSMPTKVVEMFTQFQSTKTKAGDVLKELNLVYERASTQKDIMTPDCEDKRADMAREVSNARAGLKDVEGHLTRLQGHMQSVQTGMDQNLAEVESLREQFEAHRKVCAKNKQDSATMLKVLQTDVPKAKKLATEAHCTSVLTECSMPNGEFVTTLKDANLRKMIANFSGVTEKIIALNLDRLTRARIPAPSPAASGTGSGGGTFLQVKAQRLRGAASKVHKNRHHRHHRRSPTPPASKGVALLQRYLVHRSVPNAWCSDVTPAPSCQAFKDVMATFLGNVDDLVRDLMGKSQAQEEHCRVSLEGYEEQIRELRRQADDGAVALANAAAEHTEIVTLRRERRSQTEDVTKEADREVATCGQQLKDFDQTLCSAKKLKKEMGSAVAEGKFMGDCEVGDWVRGPCNATCGDSGVQTMTREVITSAGATATCPPLTFQRPCNRRLCPVDGLMGGWEPWSQCTRACGGGTRSRHRRVLREAQHGGLPTAETMQEQLCNSQPCDQDCLLDDWTPWTNCSKTCNRGHKSRERKVIRPPLGEGTCTDEKSAERLQVLPCNKTACDKMVPPVDKLAKCSEQLDVAVVLDVSGSVGATSVEKLKTFTKGMYDRMQPANTTVGIVFFGSAAKIASPLTNVAADLDTKIATVAWQQDSTNTAQALAVTRTLFEEKARTDAKQVVIVVTDGMPVSAFLTGVEVGRLKKEQNARLLFVPVGRSVSQHVLQRWASWPWEENVVSAASYGNLDDKKVTEVLANICGANLKA